MIYLNNFNVIIDGTPGFRLENRVFSDPVFLIYGYCVLFCCDIPQLNIDQTILSFG